MLYMDTCTTHSIQDIRCIIYEALSKPLDSFPFPRICWVVHSTDFQGLRLGLNTDLGQETRIVWSQKRSEQCSEITWYDMRVSSNIFEMPELDETAIHRCYIEVWMLLFCTAASISSAVLTTRIPSSTSSALWCTRSHQSADFTLRSTTFENLIL